MTKEIKFRGKREIDKKWVYGSLFYQGKYNRYLIGYWIDLGISSGYTWDLVIPETVEQLMPIKDDNGIELYEGDIVAGERTPDNPMTSYFDISAAKKRTEYRLVAYKVTDEGITFRLPKDISYSERIKENNIKWVLAGNKWDNPELLNLITTP